MKLTTNTYEISYDEGFGRQEALVTAELTPTRTKGDETEVLLKALEDQHGIDTSAENFTFIRWSLEDWSVTSENPDEELKQLFYGWLAGFVVSSIISLCIQRWVIQPMLRNHPMMAFPYHKMLMRREGIPYTKPGGLFSIARPTNSLQKESTS